MASTSKTTRECTRAPKCSILLNNVLAITLTPSFDADLNDVTINDPKPQSSCITGKKLFDSFIDSNKSTLNTRLNECLSEVRFSGWIPPSTILLKAPQEEIDVLIEAWRRRFLRSPDRFVIRELGTIKSIDTEVIQQAPFLPLTKAVYEAILALNKNKLPSGQKQVFEYLAHTYQYVHVPKPNVIRDCLGILFKEGKVYANENSEFFVYVDTESEATSEDRKERKSSNAEELPKEKPEGVRRVKKHDRHTDQIYHYETHGKVPEVRSNGKKDINTSLRECEDVVISSGVSKERKHDKTTEKKTDAELIDTRTNSKKSKGNKKTLWGQISGFMKGKNNESKDSKTNDDERITCPPRVPSSPLRNGESSSTVKDEEEGRMTPLGASLNEKQIDDQIKRSSSFTQQTKKRPGLTKSNSFTGNNNRHKPTDHDVKRTLNDVAKRPNDINLHQNVSKSSSRDHSPKIEKTSIQNSPETLGNSSCTVGVVRPYTENQREDLGRVVMRQNSLKTARKMVMSMPSTPTNNFRDHFKLYQTKDGLPQKHHGSLTPSNDVHHSTSTFSQNRGSPSNHYNLSNDKFDGSSTAVSYNVRNSTQRYGTSTPTHDQHNTSREENSSFVSDGTRTSTKHYRNSLNLSSDLRTRNNRAGTSSSSTLVGSIYSDPRGSFLGHSTPNSAESPKHVMRDSRSLTRSLSLREHRTSDITPLMHQKTANFNQNFMSNESPLQHLLTKNTGNTLPLNNHSGYIPGAVIQDRSRPTPRRSYSFNQNKTNRLSWRETSQKDSSERPKGASPKPLVDGNLRLHDELFSAKTLQNHHKTLPCDCSETGFSENSYSRFLSDSTEAEKRAPSSDCNSSSSKKVKNQRSNSMYSTSDNGIILDEISSSCSSEIQSIMNQDKLHHQETCEKGEVTMDSSLKFIGII